MNTCACWPHDPDVWRRRRKHIASPFLKCSEEVKCTLTCQWVGHLGLCWRLALSVRRNTCFWGPSLSSDGVPWTQKLRTLLVGAQGCSLNYLKVPSFRNRSKYSFACFVCWCNFCLPNFCLAGASDFMFSPPILRTWCMDSESELCLWFDVCFAPRSRYDLRDWLGIEIPNTMHCWPTTLGLQRISRK